MNQVKKIYYELYEKYGPQGWWPLLDLKGTNPTKTGNLRGYHPEDFSYPKNKKQEFEICIGAILAQNTSWTNVEKALLILKKENLIDPIKILNADDEALKDAIRPSGYFNQKAKKLKIFSRFFLELKTIPTREQLLDVWGIGKETADSILLYAYKQSIFVVDAYTRRMFSDLGMINKEDDYDKIRNFFESCLEKDYKMYQEYHALIVENSKNKN